MRTNVLEFTAPEIVSNVLFSLVSGLFGYYLIHGITALSRSRKRALHLDEITQCQKSKKHWLTGHIREYNLLSHDGLIGGLQRIKTFPKMFCFWPHSFHAVVHFYDPATVAPLLSKNYKDAPKNPRIYDLIRPWLGQGLITSDGAIWAKHRRLITPAFHFNVLKQYNQVFNDCSKVLVNKWMNLCRKSDQGSGDDLKSAGTENRNEQKDSDKEVTNRNENEGIMVEVSNPLALMTFDSLMKCALSMETHCQTLDPPFVDAVRELEKIAVQRIESPWRLLLFQDWIFYMTEMGKRFTKVLNEINSFADEVISKRREERKDHHSDDSIRSDFLDILLKAKEGSQVLSNKEIRDEVNTFMFAGHDTTASSMSWAMYNLAKYPDVQEKCRQEVNRVLQDSEDITWEMLPELKYLTMVLKENLRLYPPVIVAARELKSNVDIPSPDDGKTVTIPKGTRSTAFIFMVHRNPYIWKDPNTFDPERFSPENRANIPAYAFIPFSAGPRNCIGQAFAMNEMKVTMAYVIRNFRLSLSGDVPVPKMKPNIILQSENGVYVLMEAINK